jgi:hypothetical protein
MFESAFSLHAHGHRSLLDFKRTFVFWISKTLGEFFKMEFGDPKMEISCNISRLSADKKMSAELWGFALRSDWVQEGSYSPTRLFYHPGH